MNMDLHFLNLHTDRCIDCYIDRLRSPTTFHRPMEPRRGSNDLDVNQMGWDFFMGFLMGFLFLMGF